MELAHTIMEDDKFKIFKINVVIQVQNLSTGRMAEFSLVQGKLVLFVFRCSSDYIRPTHIIMCLTI